MAVTFVGSSTLTGTASTVVIQRPASATVGDLLVMSIVTVGGINVDTAPNGGWKPVLNGPVTGNASADFSHSRGYVYYKIQAGGEPLSYSALVSIPGDGWATSIMAFRGARESDPVETTSVGTDQTITPGAGWSGSGSGPYTKTVAQWSGLGYVGGATAVNKRYEVKFTVQSLTAGGTMDVYYWNGAASTLVETLTISAGGTYTSYATPTADHGTNLSVWIDSNTFTGVISSIAIRPVSYSTSISGNAMVCPALQLSASGGALVTFGFRYSALVSGYAVGSFSLGGKSVITHTVDLNNFVSAWNVGPWAAGNTGTVTLSAQDSDSAPTWLGYTMGIVASATFGAATTLIPGSLSMLGVGR